MLTPTCPTVNKVPREKIIELLHQGLGQKIPEQAALYPDMIKEKSDFFVELN